MIRAYKDTCRRFTVTGVALAGVLAVGCSTRNTNPMISSEHEVTYSETSRGLEEPSKLSPALQRLAAVSEDTSRDIGSPDDSGQAPSTNEVGTPVPGTKDLFQVGIHVSPTIDLKALTAAGAYIQTRLGNIIYATVHVRDMLAVAEVDGVEEIDAIGGGRIPTPPKGPLQTLPTGGAARDLESGKTDAVKFDHQGLTGKGVVVGIIDTGIDWRHPDFINPDGTSRIKYLWDIFDNSWENSHHTVGSAPPNEWEPGKPMGTVYTNQQITAAIKGQLKIARTDTVGHGTACAGTAVGNVLGVAPQADLVVVDTHIDDADSPENDGSGAIPAANWVRQIAAKENKPCVISMSFGTPMGPHDGTGEWEDGLNELVDHGKAPGVVVCASAGNDGQHSMHARGRFGPGVESELTGGMASPVQLIVTKKTELTAYFDSRDDWGMLILGQDKFLFGTDQKPGHIKIHKKSVTGKTHADLVVAGSDNLSRDDQAKVKSMFNDKSLDLDALKSGTDMVTVQLLPGTYYVIGGGHSRQVSKGVYDMYLPDPGSAGFATGGDHKLVVGSPGDATDVITVGSYDCCNQWVSMDGTTTFSGQVDLGNISDFSSAGFRRDGAIKPDIAAPGNFMISAFANGSGLAEAKSMVTKDGKHVAWRGTSASCPYTAGVIALMLEKNPQLTVSQVKKILSDTADHDLAVTGAVPNGEWGYGKLNAEKALKAVTPGVAVVPVPVATPSPATQPAPVANPDPFANKAPANGGR